MNPRILALDVHYHLNTATAAGVLFCGWNAEQPLREAVVQLSDVAEYQPGEFFRRELPCLVSVIREFENEFDLFLIDGYVWLDDNMRPGLGSHLYEEFGRRIPVVGVAKTHFHLAPAVEVIRGASHTPLYISTVGIDDNEVAECVLRMPGPYRIPTLIKRADQLSRGHREC